jgi:molecular chaperone GrpE
MSNNPSDKGFIDETELDSNSILEDDAAVQKKVEGGGGNPEAETTNDSDCDDVNSLMTEIAELKEQALRAYAELQNVRRRAEQDVEKARKFALEKFVSELLPVADNLERAIASGNTEDQAQKAVLEGVQLTYKSLMDTLKKFQVEVIDPEGEPFDPKLHQSVSMVPSPDVEENTVINVFQKGYTLSGRLVRPAMVVVSSAPPAKN